ncbi:hypothetical protein [Blastopirellula marina]|uniref:Uncharacterized protein n=1 Tax=Blastopirellula marina TaxID=124 RepID=A0A2S8GGB5_9BACT|nr:hypothetical protein [Blastopirellula marina]PQO43505.1 hypothetical protein C5Y93_22895 [Blastopirellula marina]
MLQDFYTFYAVLAMSIGLMVTTAALYFSGLLRRLINARRFGVWQLLGFMLAIALIVGVYARIEKWNRPNTQFERLLSGSESHSVTRLRIIGSQRVKVIEDQGSCELITSAMRRPASVGYVPVRSLVCYDSTIKLDSGESVQAGIGVFDDNGPTLVIMHPLNRSFSDPKFYTVPLGASLPPELEKKLMCFADE